MPPRSKKAAAKGKSKKQNASVQERSIQRDEPLNIPRIAVTSEITDVTQRSRSPSRVDDSVIMLSSAETTRVELNDQDPSLMMLTGIDLSRPSTRLGHTDMTLEETGGASLLRSTRSYGADERTNTSDMNIDQTLVNRGDMPKISVAVRRTGSNPSLAALGTDLIDATIRPSRHRSRSRRFFSGDFVTDTRRGKVVQSREKSTASNSTDGRSAERMIDASESNVTKRGKNVGNRDEILPESKTRTRSASRTRKPKAPEVNRKRGQSKRKSVNNETSDAIAISESMRKSVEEHARDGHMEEQAPHKRVNNVTKRNRNIAVNQTTTLNDQRVARAPNHDDILSDSRVRTRSSSRTRKPSVQESNSKRGRSKKRDANSQPNSATATNEELVISTSNSKLDTVITRRKRKSVSDEIQNHSSGSITINESQSLMPEVPNSVGVENSRRKSTENEDEIQPRARTRSTSRSRKPIVQVLNDKRERSKRRKDANIEPNEATVTNAEQDISTGISHPQTVTTRRRHKSISDENQNHSIESTSNIRGAITETSTSAINENLEHVQHPSVTMRRRRPVIPQDILVGSNNTEKDQTHESSSHQDTYATSDVFAVPTVTVRKRNKLKAGDNHISQNSITSQNELSSGEDLSENRTETEQFSNVSKRRRPKPNPDKDGEHTVSSDNIPSSSENESPVKSSETVMGSIAESQQASRSVSRGRQPVVSEADSLLASKRVRVKKKPLCACCSSEHHEDAKAAAPVIPPQTREPRSRSRNPTKTARSVSKSTQPSESAPSAADTATEQDTTSTGKRRGRSRTRRNAPKNPSRSKSELRTAKYNENSFRSQSVPKDANDSHNQQEDSIASHVPIYRKFTGESRKRSESVKSLILLSPEPVMGDGDIYAFDSPSQPAEGGTSKKAKKAGLPKKRSRSKNVSHKRTSPSKKGQHSVFGTDMHRIDKVLRKIGGGPVRQKRDASAGSEKMMDTATLASIVRPLQPPTSPQKPRTPSPAFQHDANDDDHHHYEDIEPPHDNENIPAVETPLPVSPPPAPARTNPQLHRVLQQTIPEANTPDKAQPNATLGFSPLGASSPWRVQDENILPKTFYFSRSRDLLPSYESDIVARHDESQPPKSPAREIAQIAAPAPISKTPPEVRLSQPTIAVAATNAETVFRGIQKSYEQLKVTSEMSEKLISAMRSYKSNIRNQTASFCESPSDIGEDQRLIAKFREYEENMKKTYRKLKQWYERSQQALKYSIQSIEKVSAVPKTQSQKEVLRNFHRDSELFVTMINELESAMNDSNIENISPPATAKNNKERPAFKDIILPNRNANNKNRSPLKALDIVNVPTNFSPVSSPLVKASFSAFNSDSKRQNSLSRSKDRLSRVSLVKPIQAPPTAPTQEPSVIELADTFVEPEPQLVTETSTHSHSSSSANSSASPKQPDRDLFGFEADETPEEETLVAPTPAKITKETLKERLQSVRKLLRPPSRNKQTSAAVTSTNQMPKIFNSPRKLRSVRTAFTASTPVAEKREQASRKKVEPDPNISAIAGEGESEQSSNKNQEDRTEKDPSPSGVVLFEEPEPVLFTSLTSVNRTYTRIPRRNHKRKRNVYLAGLGLSDDDDDDDDDRGSVVSLSDDDEANAGRKKQAKKRRVAKSRKKNTVEETNEFKQFVNDFNSMCDEVNRYQLVIENPPDAR